MDARLYVCDSLSDLPTFAKSKILIEPADNETLYVYGDANYMVWAYAGLGIKASYVEEVLERSYLEGPKNNRSMGRVRR